MFAVVGKSGEARAGTLKTKRGEITTPIFMPVGTRASVKTLSNDDLKSLGAQIILANTYHLYLRPGHKLVEEMGGLHRFMNWNQPILTDSGGFQIFSLGDLNKVSLEGVTFRSHLDGSSHLLTPELSMEIQRALGSDIVMAFDHCPSLPTTTEQLENSLQLTLNWAKRCKDVPLQEGQQLFAIVQGGLDLKLRMDCLESLKEMDFDGFAIGGLSVGEKNEEMLALLTDFAPAMPEDKPRYLMGVGSPLEVMAAVKSGIDMFDCVLPTRNARNGQILTPLGPINIKRQEYARDSYPPDPDCPCPMCSQHSRAYIRHLWTVGEYLAGRLISYHNLLFYMRLMAGAREAILQGSFDEYYQKFYKSYTSQT